MPLILPANTLSTGGFSVANSCRFNDGDSPSLTKTATSFSSATTGTFSFWIKRGALGATQYLFANYASGSSQGLIKFNSDDTLTVNDYDGTDNIQLTTNRVFRDPSAWMSIVLRIASSESTEADRARLYINGTQETSFATETYPTSGESLKFFANSASGDHVVGANQSDASNFDGYLAECVYCDGQSLGADSFGEFDSDSPTIFKPIDVSGLTFGNNGWYLDFEDSDNLGDDESGNASDFTETNIDATDQASDSPTNNFCTMNPLIPTTEITFSEGNCKTVTHASSDNYGAGVGTFGLTAGKWYWEIKMASLLGNHTHGVISELTAELYQNVTGLQMDTGVTNFRNDDGGEMIKDGTQTTADYGTFDDGDIMGIAFNADDNQISIYDNGSAIVSNYAISTTRGTLFPYIGSGINTTFEVNFGGCPAFAITSGNADANGYGNMEFAVPENYYVLCSANLAEFGG